MLIWAVICFCISSFTQCSDPAFEKAPLLHVMAIFVAIIKHSSSEVSCTSAGRLQVLRVGLGHLQHATWLIRN